MRRSQAPSQQRKPLLQLKSNTSLCRPMTLTYPKTMLTTKAKTPDENTTPTTKPTESKQQEEEGGSEKASEAKAYKVFWCNFTRKKHKTYNDGVLITNGAGGCTLLDEEGKVLCKSTTMGRAALHNLQSGSLLTVCSKDVEINEEVPYSKYQSGSLFIHASPATATAATASTSAIPTVKRSAQINALLTSKKFPSGPLRRGGGGGGQLPPPRHDPGAAGALVLDPGKEGQSVAVVMDPYLAKHLREHQREGVKFMYECVMGLKEPHMLGCILADEMGLGKTFQAICVLWTLLKQGPKGVPTIRKAMIVCPNTLISVKSSKKIFFFCFTFNIYLFLLC